MPRSSPVDWVVMSQVIERHNARRRQEPCPEDAARIRALRYTDGPLSTIVAWTLSQSGRRHQPTHSPSLSRGNSRHDEQGELLVIVGCHGNDSAPACPHLDAEGTPGAGCAADYYCTSEGKRRMVDGYVEWDSEKRKEGDFPTFCPLAPDTRRKR